MTKQLEDYPELDKWCDDNFIHESDSTPFECYEAEAAEQKILSMQQQIDSLTKERNELAEHLCSYEGVESEISSFKNSLEKSKQRCENRAKRINSLTEQNKELQVGFDEISELILDCFGKHPVPCDGMLYVPSHKYNNLARLLNELNKESK